MSSLVILGLSVTSSWGNGHATTYRALLKGLQQLGYDVLFLERDAPWYAENRDCRAIAGCRIELYTSLADLRRRFEAEVKNAGAVIVGSYVPQGADVLRWVLDTAHGRRLFYDIDTPITLANLARETPTYIAPESIPELDAYLSFSSGPVLEIIEQEHGAKLALPLCCSVDPDLYRPVSTTPTGALSYLGTYSDDRQPALETLMLAAARELASEQFVVGGAGYPELDWPENVARVEHVNPGEHAVFYGQSRFTLNITRQDMKRLGHSPSVRLFEAAACGTAIISDEWPGLSTFFEPEREILVASDTEQVLRYLRDLPAATRRAVASRARARVLCEHTADQRSRQLASYLESLALPERLDASGLLESSSSSAFGSLEP
ncbi:MAG TPA: glycosyltransferase [Polyangiaceae bacterium]|jgi:spore maturation protein CgeB|nr:glycosyltransferase [Polyangiaceae bacterium]